MENGYYAKVFEDFQNILVLEDSVERVAKMREWMKNHLVQMGVSHETDRKAVMQIAFKHDVSNELYGMIAHNCNQNKVGERDYKISIETGNRVDTLKMMVIR